MKPNKSKKERIKEKVWEPRGSEISRGNWERTNGESDWMGWNSWGDVKMTWECRVLKVKIEIVLSWD